MSSEPIRFAVERPGFWEAWVCWPRSDIRSGAAAERIEAVDRFETPVFAATAFVVAVVFAPRRWPRIFEPSFISTPDMKFAMFEVSSWAWE